MENMINRTYSMSDADLAQFTTNLAGFLTRDLADLADFGMTAAKITALQTLQNAFEVLTPDYVYVAIVSQKVEIKNNVRTTMEDMLGKIRVRALNVFGENSPIYKEFNFTRVNAAADATYVSRCRSIAATAEKYLTELAAFGQTQAQIDAFIAECDSFETAMRDIASAVSDRLTGTRLRIEKGNELYGFVSTYCSLGKATYANTNYAKYQDYVVYGSEDVPHTAPQTPENVTFQNDVISWSPSPTATSYKLYQSLTPSGDDWSVIDEGNDTMAIVPHIFIGGRRFRVTAHNGAGTSAPSAEIYNIASVNTPTGFMYADGQLMWHQVEWANGYYVEQSQNGTDWTEIWNQNTASMPLELQPGTWFYRIRSGYANVYSGYSPIVELDGGTGNVGG